MANSPILAIPLLSASQAAKETTINTMVSYLERAMNDNITINFAGLDYTLPETDLKRYFNFTLTGGGATSALNITAMKRMFALNNLANGNPVILNCGSDSLTIPAGGIVLVLCDGFNLISVADSTIMGGGAGGVTTFLGLSDVPSSYALQGKRVVRVKEDLTGLEFHAFNLTDSADVDVTGIADGYILTWDADTSKWVAVAPSAGGGSSSPYLKDPCVVATTTNVDLTGSLVAGTMLDGVLLVEGWRVLVKNQTVESENGIYIVPAAGAATRATDANEDAEFPQGAIVPVVLGTLNGGSIFLQTETPVVVGTTPINFKTKGLALSTLADVDVTTTPPTNGQVLKYSDAEQKWIPGDDIGGSENSLSNLNDVDMDPAPTDGQVLTWNAADGVARFVDGAAGGSDITLAVFAAGTLDDGEMILAHDVVTPFEIISYGDSRASATSVSTGTAVFTIKKNGTSIGTVTFTSSSVGVISGAGGSFVVGDKLTIEAPATADATLRNVSISLKGVR